MSYAAAPTIVMSNYTAPISESVIQPAVTVGSYYMDSNLQQTSSMIAYPGYTVAAPVTVAEPTATPAETKTETKSDAKTDAKTEEKQPQKKAKKVKKQKKGCC